MALSDLVKKLIMDRSVKGLKEEYSYNSLTPLVQKIMRKGENSISSEELPEVIKQRDEILDLVDSGGDIPEGLVLNRGISSYYDPNQWDNYEIGDVITGDGMGSFSTNPGTANAFAGGENSMGPVFKLTTDGKTPGAIVGGTESEVVMPPGNRFKVEGKSRDPVSGGLKYDLESTNDPVSNSKRFYQALAMAGGASALDPSSAEASTPSIKDILQDVLAAKTSPSDLEQLYLPPDPTIGTFLNPAGYPKSTEPPVEETSESGIPSMSDILDMIKGATGDLSGVLSSGQGFPSTVSDYARGIGMLKGFGPFAAAELAGITGDAILNTDTVRQLLNGKNLSDQYDEQAQVKVKNVLDPLIADGTLSPEIINSLAPKLRAYFREREDWVNGAPPPAPPIM